MLRRLVKLWMCWCIAVFIALGCSYVDSAFAQVPRHEPSILGVGYSVMADWQRQYRGGPGLYDCPPSHVPYWYVQPEAQLVFMEPFPLRKAKRVKALKKRSPN